MAQDKTPRRRSTRKPDGKTEAAAEQETGAEQGNGAQASGTRRSGSSSAAKPRSPRTRRTTSTAAEPLEEAVRRRAYEIYVSRGGADGSALEDWLQAERELGPAYEEAR